MKEAPYKTLTDEQYMETLRHGCADFPFRYYEEDVWKFDLHRIDWHWHKEVEFVYAERGDVVCYAGADKFTLPQGCGLFVNGGALHRYEAEQSVSMPNIVFLPELLGAADGRVFRKYIEPVLRLGAGHLLLCPQDGRQREMLEILTSIFALWRTSDPSELVTVQKLLALWQLLAEQLPPAEGAHQPGETAHGKRLQLMMQYIHEIKQIFRPALAYVVQFVRRDRQSVNACFPLGSPVHHQHDPFHYIIYVCKVPHALAEIENLDFLPCQKLVRKAEICHVRTSCRTIDCKKAKPCGRYVIQFRICMGQHFIAFLGGGIQGDREISPVVNRVWSFRCFPIYR